MLWILTLEPLEERYTKQWRKWFADYVSSHQIRAQFIDGEILTDHVETGLVLDAAGTNYWKASQMRNVCKLFQRGLVKNGDKFFTMDLWHPGLESVPYMAQLYGIEVSMYGFLHAGSYTSGDFAEPMTSWASYFERGWVSICKRVFFGSNYHLDDFSHKRGGRGMESGCLMATGCPFDSRSMWSGRPVRERENFIAFPHRFDPEKRPDVLVDVMNRLCLRRQDFTVFITTGRRSLRNREYLNSALFTYIVLPNLMKSAYYDILRQCKVVFSCADAENFGYGVTEGAALGCHPVVPARLSYPELIPERYLYFGSDMAVDMLSSALDYPVSVEQAVVDQWDGALQRIFEGMGYI